MAENLASGLLRAVAGGGSAQAFQANQAEKLQRQRIEADEANRARSEAMQNLQRSQGLISNAVEMVSDPAQLDSLAQKAYGIDGEFGDTITAVVGEKKIRMERASKHREALTQAAESSILDPDMRGYLTNPDNFPDADSQAKAIEKQFSIQSKPKAHSKLQEALAHNESLRDRGLISGVDAQQNEIRLMDGLMKTAGTSVGQSSEAKALEAAYQAGDIDYKTYKDHRMRIAGVNTGLVQAPINDPATGRPIGHIVNPTALTKPQKSSVQASFIQNSQALAEINQAGVMEAAALGLGPTANIEAFKNAAASLPLGSGWRGMLLAEPTDAARTKLRLLHETLIPAMRRSGGVKMPVHEQERVEQLLSMFNPDTFFNEPELAAGRIKLLTDTLARQTERLAKYNGSTPFALMYNEPASPEKNQGFSGVTGKEDNPYRPTTRAEAENVPGGAYFVGNDGKVHRKKADVRPVTRQHVSQ